MVNEILGSLVTPYSLGIYALACIVLAGLVVWKQKHQASTLDIFNWAFSYPFLLIYGLAALRSHYIMTVAMPGGSWDLFRETLPLVGTHVQMYVPGAFAIVAHVALYLALWQWLSRKGPALYAMRASLVAAHVANFYFNEIWMIT